MNSRLRKFSGVMLIAAAVAACGGGGGGSGDGGSDPGGGIDRGGITIALGPINGFGSVIVNGVRYSTGGASITVDGQPATESDLRVGQVVRVEGRLDAGGSTGTATRISYDDNVEGPVESLDLIGQRLVVLGQSVQVSRSTSFDDGIVPRSLEGLATGDRIEVSGLFRADGVIDATRIERRNSAGEFELKGLASAVDAAARRLTVNSLVVDWSGAQLEGFASGQPANGDFIEIKGTLLASGLLQASRLQKEDAGIGGSDGDDGDLEGLVTRFVSAADFDVAGQRVATTATTRFEGGTVANLALNARVEVEGRIDGSGRIVATEVKFRLESTVEISGRVDSVSVAEGRFSMLGRTVRTTALTRFEDHSSADLERFGLANLGVGDYVELRAYEDGAELVATLLERDDPEADIELTGIAADVAAPNLSVGGVAVTTDAGTEYRNRDGTITAAEFFALAPGREVKIRGTLVGNTVLAERAELED